MHNFIHHGKSLGAHRVHQQHELQQQQQSRGWVAARPGPRAASAVPGRRPSLARPGVCAVVLFLVCTRSPRELTPTGPRPGRLVWCCRTREERRSVRGPQDANYIDQKSKVKKAPSETSLRTCVSRSRPCRCRHLYSCREDPPLAPGYRGHPSAR